MAALAERAATQVSLDDAGAVARLLDSLREAGVVEQVAALAERLPAAGHFHRFVEIGDHRKRVQIWTGARWGLRYLLDVGRPGVNREPAFDVRVGGRGRARPYRRVVAP